MGKAKDVQATLPGIPEVVSKNFRVNFQYQGPNYALRAGSLIIPAETIEQARGIALDTIAKMDHGWTRITKITTINDEVPF